MFRVILFFAIVSAFVGCRNCGTNTGLFGGNRSARIAPPTVGGPVIPRATTPGIDPYYSNPQSSTATGTTSTRTASAGVWVPNNSSTSTGTGTSGSSVNIASRTTPANSGTSTTPVGSGVNSSSSLPGSSVTIGSRPNNSTGGTQSILSPSNQPTSGTGIQPAPATLITPQSGGTSGFRGSSTTQPSQSSGLSANNPSGFRSITPGAGRNELAAIMLPTAVTPPVPNSSVASTTPNTTSTRLASNAAGSWSERLR